MDDAQPDLPPVGELVQITTADGWTAVGCRTGDLPWVHAVGRPPVACTSIKSWCRALVLPDTETTERSARMKVWATLEEIGVEHAKAVSVVVTNTVLAALREAAIR